jgi:hypothetical protein
MTNPSNLYAEKIFAEHPLALWALDDKVDYVSLINESQRNVSNWNFSSNSYGESFNFSSSVLNEPFPESSVSLLGADVPSSQIEQIVAISDDILNFNEFSSSLSTFSVGACLYSVSPYINSVEIGYEYYDTTTSSTVQHLKSFDISLTEQWFFVSETFKVLPESATVRIVIKINYLSGSLNPEDYLFLLNGVTLGQWSEEFQSTSLGINPQDLPSGIFSSTIKGIKAYSYGLEEEFGYYLVDNKTLVAKNSGLPIVYGSSNVTNISPNSNDLPSIVIPGKGFLNKLGQYKEYTLEMWLKLAVDCTEPKKIVGNIRGDNGLWVDGSFLILKVGSNIGSYFVGEWDRPMLVHITFSENNASLIINGEQVISLTYISQDLSLPDISTGALSNDWIGFWSYDDVYPFQIDCVAIYPYKVSSIVATRRFVYGQGVEFPEGINQSYSGTSVFIDYPFADYTNNYSYPNMASWNQGAVDNLTTSNGILSVPQYFLPDIVISNKTEADFYSDNASNQDESSLFFSLYPGELESWSYSEGYLLFDNLSFLQEEIKCFYGIFKSKAEATDEVLIHIDSANSNDYFQISLSGDAISYNLNYNGVLETIYESYGYSSGEQFVAGIHIDSFVSYFGGNVASFFGNRGSLRLYVGGKKELSNTFKGNIYSVGFSNNKNYQQIKDFFNELGTPTNYENIFNMYGGLVDYDAGETYFGNEASYWDFLLDGGTPSGFITYMLLDHVASYTLSPTLYFDQYSLDIDINGSWKDYVPLSYFAQYVKDAKNDFYYDLDFLQFNVNYPEPSKFVEESSSGTWTYQDLKEQYSIPLQRTYESLDNHLFTGYNDYSDLQNKSVKNYKYDTSSEIVKTYISFEYLASGANAIDEFFTYIEAAPKEGIIEPGTNWINTKYEVVNNMILYPPKTSDLLDIAVVTHVDFIVRSSLKKKVNIKSLQICSQAFNDVAPNPIGTRFGTSIYPYKKTGIYYDYKSPNPFTIYKGSSPYLYTTRHSGIELKGTYDPLVSRGISIPINQNAVSSFKVIAMQAAIRYTQDFFPYAATEIFEIEARDRLIKIYMVANDPQGKRAKIYAIDAYSGQLVNDIGFYWNGKVVKEPIMTIKEWGFLGLSFTDALNFSNIVGSIKITGPILANTISHYQSTNLQEKQKVVNRLWFKVKEDNFTPLDWDFWDSPNVTWNNVLILASSSYYGVDPSIIYKVYTGTNKIIVGDGPDKVLKFGSYQYLIYQDVLWQTNTINAV